MRRLCHFTTFLHSILGSLLFALVIVEAACGEATATPSQPTPLPTIAMTPPATATVLLATPASPQPQVSPTVPSTATSQATITRTPTGQRARSTPTRTRAPSPSAATLGKIAYTVVTGSDPKLHTIWTANLDGSGARKVLESAGWPALSPDGKRLAFYQISIGVTSPGLYLATTEGANITPVHINSGVCCLSWSHDGNWVVFATSRRASQPGGPISMIKMDGYHKTIIDLKVQGNGPSLSPDGKQVVFSGCLPNTTTCGVLVAAADGSGTPRALTNDNGGNARWSPKGDKIAYQGMDAAGHHQVFLINADGSGKKQLTTGKSNDGQPTWSRDGGSLFWRSDQNGTEWAIFRMGADGSNQRRILSGVAPDPNLWAWESLSAAP